eukprot:TRINITY_DN5680_c0_g1_i1.p1 TRINITY_DN5680_c0_g1~~TRINITY_DN5680_c0_g1_i1.p1  ORF type:complete len:132 (+),score=30.80 TRINITY_DN5680_c0_g1_i1:15-410(+)
MAQQKRTVGGLGLHWDHPLVPDDMRALVKSACEKTNIELEKDGIHFEFCPTAPEMTQEDIENFLKKHVKDAYLIGGGVRMFPQCLILLERLVNTIPRIFPGAKIIFNEGLDDVSSSCRRAFPELEKSNQPK